MKTSNIKGSNTKSKGRFLTVTIENSRGRESFVGKIKKIGKSFVTFLKVSGEKGEVRYHINSIKGIR